MSHPPYNPYASGNQSSTQGQYGLSSVQAEMDPQRASSSSGPGSSFSFSGTYSVTSANSVGICPSLLPQTVSYRPEQSRAIIDKNIEKSIDIHISRASKGVRLLGKPIHQHRNSRLTRIQRECLSSETGMVSYPQPMSSTYAALVESSSSSSDCSSNYERPTADEPSKFDSSLAGSGDSVLIASSEREQVMQSVPDLGQFEYPLSDKPAAPTESSQPKYTSESASNTLLYFGLDTEDLDHLVYYPEDQMTPANLPFILRQIRSEKTKRATTAVQLKPCPEPQPARIVWGMDSPRVSHSGGAGMRQEEIPFAVLEPSKVIDCGHTDKYTEEAGDETESIGCKRGNCGGSMLLIDTCASSRHVGEPPRKNTTEEKSTALGVSHDQATSVSSLSSLHCSNLSSAAPPSNDQTQLQIQPNHSSQTILSSSSPPKTDTDVRVVKSEASERVPLKDPEADHQSTSKTQPPSTLHSGVHPSRPDPVLIGSDDTSGNMDQSKSKAQESTVAEKMKKQQTRQQPIAQMQNEEKQPVSQTGQEILPSVFSPTESVPLASHIPSITGAMQHLPFIPVGPPPIISPPALLQPIPDLLDLIHLPLPTSNKQPLAEVSVSKDLPTAAIMHDGDANTPKNFPHTCCLCNRKCLLMEDWVSHQNTSLHLERCKLLRKSAAGKDAKPSPSPSTSSRTSRYRPKTRNGSSSGSSSHSRSRSPIPRGHCRSEGRREKPRSRSRSPHSSRYSHRSLSGSRPTSSRYRSRSKSPERRSSQRRRDKNSSWPRRRDDRQLSPRTSCKRRSSPRRTDEKRLPSFWTYKRRLPPRRTDERRSPRSRSDRRRSPRRQKLSSNENLAEKLLKNSAVQLLSKQSDLEALVKALAPIILAKLAKRKSSSSSSSSSPSPSSSNGGNTPSSSSSSSSPAKKELPKKPFQASPSLQKSETSSSTKSKLGKPSAPTMVKLKGIHSSVSRNDVLAAVEHFGNTKSFLLFPSKQEAIVCFEKEEDAKKLMSQKSLDVKGIQMAVVGGKETVPKQQNKPLTKPATSSVSPQITSTITRTVLLPPRSLPPVKGPKKPPSSPSGAQKATTGKLQKYSAKDLVKGPATVTKENTSAKQRDKTPQEFQTQLLETERVTSVTLLTVGEIIEKHLRRDRIELFKKESILWERAVVCFDKKEDTKKLKNLDVKGMPIAVVGGKETVPKQQNKPLTKPPTSSVSPQITSTMPRTVLLPTRSLPPVKGPTGKLQRSSAKDSVKGPATVTKENISAKQRDKTPQVFQTSTRSPAEDAEPKESGRMRAAAVEPIEGVSRAEGRAEKPTTSVAARKGSSNKERRPSKSTGDNRPIETLVKALLHLRKSTPSEPESTGPETKTATSGPPLTVGERVEKHLRRDRIKLFKNESVFGERAFQDLPFHCKLLLITNLPEYHDGCYTEEDLARLLEPFGFQYTEDSIFVVPQTCMAFFAVPAVGIMHEIMKASARDGIIFKGSQLVFRAVAGGITMTPIGFYKSLMGLMRVRVLGDGERIVFIKNISLRESRELREALKKIECVKNFLPLLNKVFVEFKTIRDADRLGVWYSLLKQAPDHKVLRLKTPFIGPKLPLPPKLPENALPDSRDVVAGATVPPIEIGVPQGSIGPFWITMRTHPFLFPTRSPWFLIPDYLTVRRQDDVAKAGRGPLFPTLMLTGLPAGDYEHEDVAKLVWRYFPKQNLHSLYYNVVVLPLQRRAFVFFADWTSCCDFVHDHIKHPVSVHFCPLTAHFIREDMQPFSSEETMYTSLMKWSNAGVPEPTSLEERLLCVETSETSLEVIGVVVEVVASIAPFVGFLPLANRICIEMADSGGVTKVVEKYKHRLFFRMKNAVFWSKVRHVEPLKSLKRRLQDSGEVTITFDQDSVKPPAVE